MRDGFRRSGILSFIILLTTLGFSACSGPEKAPEEAPVAESLPASLPAVDKDALLTNYAKKHGLEVAAVKEEAQRQGVFEKFGTEDLTPEEFAKWVSFMWSVDPLLRLEQLQEFVDLNALIDVLNTPKPEAAPDASASGVPADVPSRDVNLELLISQAILDQTRFQERVVEGLQQLGAKNVMGVKAFDDLPQAEAMMQDLIPLVAPPSPASAPASLPGTAPASQPQGAFNFFLVGEALAQSKTPAKAGAKSGMVKTPVVPSKKALIYKGIPAVKTKTAPLLLARAMTYRVGPGLYLAESPLRAIVPQFSAIPVDQYRFKVEKRIIGDEYRNAVEQNVQRLAAIPSRTQPQWYEMATALVELELANQIVAEFVNPEGAAAAPEKGPGNTPPDKGPLKPSTDNKGP